MYEHVKQLGPQAKTLIAKRMVQIALEREEMDREACLHFFKDFYMHDIMSKEQIRRGFDLVCIDLDDILVDTPRAIEYLFQLIVKLVFDMKLFTEMFLSRIPDILLNLQT